MIGFQSTGEAARKKEFVGEMPAAVIVNSLVGQTSDQISSAVTLLVPAPPATWTAPWSNPHTSQSALDAQEEDQPLPAERQGQSEGDMEARIVQLNMEVQRKELDLFNSMSGKVMNGDREELKRLERTLAIASSISKCVGILDLSLRRVED